MLLEVGTVVRPHGLRGQVIVHLTTNRVERVAPGSVLHTAAGPLEVASSAPAPGGAGPDRWVVAFAGVAGREAAEALRGQRLQAEPIVEDDDVLWVHELIGAAVRGVDGTEYGRVTEVHANPASDLLVLDSGALVPLHFVTGHDSGVIHVDAPPGLFDLD